MQTKPFLACGAAWLILAGAALAADPAPANPTPAAVVAASANPTAARGHGYLTKAQLPDAGPALGPPPAEGSGARQGDLQTYQATRKLQGTARWDLASRDADFGPAPMMHVYSCALGVDLTPVSAPRLYRLLNRLVTDADAVNASVKAGYKRPRPFVENGGQICVAEEDWLKKSYSYPSGHSTYSWASALTLSQIAPDRAVALMARARSYGESRIVCGVHYESDVQAGRATASLLFSALQDNPTFRADLARARLELARLRSRSKAAPDAAECAIEAQAAATPVW